MWKSKSICRQVPYTEQFDCDSNTWFVKTFIIDTVFIRIWEVMTIRMNLKSMDPKNTFSVKNSKMPNIETCYGH